VLHINISSLVDFCSLPHYFGDVEEPFLSAIGRI